MSEEPISAVDRLDLGAALAAGWDRREVEWEVKQERAANLASSGRLDEAAPLWKEALSLARDIFDAPDPRLATSLINHGWALWQEGNEQAGRSLLEEGRDCWRKSAAWIEGLRIERKARSSLYHLRMEAKHWEQFEANARKRLGRFAEEARDAAERLARGDQGLSRGFARWRGEKPAGFTDTRRLLAACLLMTSGVSPDPERS